MQMNGSQFLAFPACEGNHNIELVKASMSDKEFPDTYTPFSPNLCGQLAEMPGMLNHS
jgi:hypothetical protein